MHGQGQTNQYAPLLLKIGRINIGFLIKCTVHQEYGKCSKIPYTFLVLFSNKMYVIRAGIHKMLVRIVNREDPDQSLEAV